MSAPEGYAATRRMLAERFPRCFTAPGERKRALHPRIYDMLMQTGLLSRQEANTFLTEYMAGASYYKAVLRPDAAYHDLDGRTDTPIDEQSRAACRRMLEFVDAMERQDYSLFPEEVEIFNRRVQAGDMTLEMAEVRGPKGEVLVAQGLGSLSSFLHGMEYRWDKGRNKYVRPRRQP